MTGNVTHAWSMYSEHGQVVAGKKKIKGSVGMIPAKVNFRPPYIVDKPEGLLKRLIRVLVINGVSVKIEHLDDAQGGFCMLNGQITLILDAKARPLKLAQLCAQALSAVEDTDSLYLRPDLRDFIARQAVNLAFTKLCRQCGIKG